MTNNHPEFICKKCLAHYTGTHTCFGLMEELVKFNKKKVKTCKSCNWEEFGTPCPRCGKGKPKLGKGMTIEEAIKMAKREIAEWKGFLEEAQKRKSEKK